jgi:hypothetical protein
MRPLAHGTWGVHYETSQHFGSQATNHNAVYGYVYPIKHRFEDTMFRFQDPAALERFGIDPTRPVPLGVTVTADPYGFPLQGFTTGYTTKLPPPALDIATASRLPQSFNQIGFASSSNGNGGTSTVPSDEPVSFANSFADPTRGQWQYGSQAGIVDYAHSVVQPSIEEMSAVEAAIRRNNPNLKKDVVSQALRNAM